MRQLLRPDGDHRVMTIGELSRRTGVSVKVLRRYDSQGLLYPAGRSAANYRLYDESALWCVSVVSSLRGLGLTVAEIKDLAQVYLDAPHEPIGPHLAAVLGIFLALYLTWWYAPALEVTSDAVLLFYGGSMLVAAARGVGRCEVLAVSYWMLGREDEVGCVLFNPVDRLEQRAKASTTP